MSQVFKINGFAVDLSQVTDIEYFKGRYIGATTFIGVKGCDKRRRVDLTQDEANTLIDAWTNYKKLELPQ